MEKQKDSSWLDSFAWLCAAAAFSPAAYWLYLALSKSGQLRDAVVVLATALAVLAIEYKIRPHKPAFSGDSACWLAGGYAAIFSAKYFGAAGAIVSLAGFCAAIVALGLACFDRRRYVYAGGGAFFVFVLLSFFLRAFDLPLRILAGRLSARILSLFNDSVALVSYGGESAQIGLRAGGRSYLVATECNGFGIIAGCVLLSVVCAIFAKNVPVWKRVGAVALAGIFAYLVNSLRIVAIVSLAPFVSDYHFMHETVGYIFFASALLAVWTFSRKL